jgi:uncharacterized membrane protein
MHEIEFFRVLGATMFTTGTLTLWFMARPGLKEKKAREASWKSIQKVMNELDAQ